MRRLRRPRLSRLRVVSQLRPGAAAPHAHGAATTVARVWQSLRHTLAIPCPVLRRATVKTPPRQHPPIALQHEGLQATRVALCLRPTSQATRLYRTQRQALHESVEDIRLSCAARNRPDDRHVHGLVRQREVGCPLCKVGLHPPRYVRAVLHSNIQRRRPPRMARRAAKHIDTKRQQHVAEQVKHGHTAPPVLRLSRNTLGLQG
jgi:hypothetical protein